MKSLLLGLAPLAALALASGPAGDAPTITDPSPPEPPKPASEEDKEPVSSQHSVKVGGKTLEYTATSGFLPIKNDKGETEARLFFTAYTLNSTKKDSKRPLMFSFNGGPGSASVWLHLGGLAPVRVEMLDDGAMPPPPFNLIENEFTWLDETDLVFVDPVETGYSRAASEELTKKYCGVEKDLESIGEFIRLYLTRYQRWASPLFMVGESYGTFRASGLAGLLIEKGIAFNGIVLVSSVLNLQTLVFDEGNDIPYSLYLPTYAATAWYHQRLSDDLQSRDLESFLAEVEEWVQKEYVVALAKGAALQGEERSAIAAQLARYTGLSQRYIELSNLRIHISRFCKELLREEGKTVGRLDSRYTGFDAIGVTENPDFDPSLSAIRPPFTTLLNDYLRGELGVETDREYHILRSLTWDWGTESSREGYSKTSAAMSSAFAKNPYLHLFIASGYYDLATPYFATDYTVDHLALDETTRGHVQTEKYPVGHMVYLQKAVLAKLKSDVAGFIGKALAVEPRPLPRG
jgi:carboxypeptidase C (cathepsin A)